MHHFSFWAAQKYVSSADGGVRAPLLAHREKSTHSHQKASKQIVSALLDSFSQFCMGTFRDSEVCEAHPPLQLSFSPRLVPGCRSLQELSATCVPPIALPTLQGIAAGSFPAGAEQA